MKKNDLEELVYEMEYLVGKNCYNPNSYDGYTGDEGCSFRYPVYIYPDKDAEMPRKIRGKIAGVPADQICTMKYKFGSNHLFIGNALVEILELLEERYHIDFEELERKRG